MTMACPGKVALRPAIAADVDRLFDWVNMADSLAGKLRTAEPIPYDSHRRWCDSRLADPACRIRIIELDGVPVGQLRLEPGDYGYDVDIYVEAGSRQNGLAADALAQAIADLRAGEPESVFIATIRSENQASRRLFERLGFRLSASAPDHLVYRLSKAEA